METTITWVAPLLMLPGASLLILSTASRYARIHDELHHWEGRERRQLAHTVLANLRTRARAFRDALVALYFSVSLFALGGIMGAFAARWPDVAAVLVVGFTSCAILALLFASMTLMREAVLSLTVVEAHFQSFQEYGD
jgi:hypothetical protein